MDRVLHDSRPAVRHQNDLMRLGKRDLESAEGGRSGSLRSPLISEKGVGPDKVSGHAIEPIEPFSGRKRGKPRVVAMRHIDDDAGRGGVRYGKWWRNRRPFDPEKLNLANSVSGGERVDM